MVRIGILTYFGSINNGAFLQAYAMQECLKKRYGSIADIEIINYDTKSAHEMYLSRILDRDSLFRSKLIAQYDCFLKSRKKLKLSKEEMITDDIRWVEKFLKGKYDIIIVGSDEIWKTDSFRGFPTAYWLNFDLSNTVYMAYAVSGRNHYQQLSRDMTEYIRSSIERFIYIGTRDEITRKELQKIADREIDRNCDPVFLMPELFQIPDKEKIRKEFRKKFGLDFNKRIISLMMSYNGEAAERLYKMMKHDNLVLCLYEPNIRIREHNLVELSPFEWSDLIGISDLVVTDFFHGTVFSMIHKIPFVALEHSEKGRGKIENLLIENFMADKFLYQVDYHGNNRKLALDLYTKGKQEMRHYNPSMASETMLREYRKAEYFFEILEKKINSEKNKTK